MKVVLCALNASWAHTNPAIRCLREPLERAGFETVLCEFTLKDRSAHVLERLYRERAEVYGFSCYIWNLPQMLSLARSLGRLLPNSRILLGGPEVSHATERFDGYGEISGIICGEGEDAITEVCCAIREGRSFPRIIRGGKPNVMKDEGILYRSGEKTGGILYYESSRGCPFSCAYCLSSATKGVRMKTVEQAVADLEAFEALDCQCHTVKFVDRTFNADPDRANRIWEALLSERFTKRYHFEVCAALLNEASYRILARFPKGKLRLEIGLQSTNPETLRAVSRHIRPAAVIEAVQRIHEMGNIYVHLDLIAGLPYEGYERFKQSFDQAYGCCDLLQLGFLKLLYGTELRQKAEEYGYVCLSEPPYTVLQSNWMTFSELSRLTHIAEVLERYSESGRFCHTLAAVMPLQTSPFAFWEGLCVFLEKRDSRPLQKLSQLDVYRYFLEYLTEKAEGVDMDMAKELLSVDFTASEHKCPPYFLR